MNIALRNMNSVHVASGDATSCRLEVSGALQLHGMIRHRTVSIENVQNVHVWNDLLDREQNMTMVRVPFIDYCSRGKGRFSVDSPTIQYLRLEATRTDSHIAADHIDAVHVMSDPRAQGGGHQRFEVGTVGFLFAMDSSCTVEPAEPEKTIITVEGDRRSVGQSAKRSVTKLTEVGGANAEHAYVAGDGAFREVADWQSGSPKDGIAATYDELFAAMAEAFSKNISNESVAADSLVPTTMVSCAVVSGEGISRSSVRASDLGLDAKSSRNASPSADIGLEL